MRKNGVLSGHMQEDPDGTGDPEPLDSDAPSLPVEPFPFPVEAASSFPTSEGLTQHDPGKWPWPPGRQLPQGQYWFSSGPTQFASRTITRLKCQQAPRGEVERVTHEEEYYTPKELLRFSDVYREKWENTWELRQQWKGCKVGLGRTYAMGSLSRGSALNAAARGRGRALTVWLVGWRKRGPNGGPW